MKKKACEHWILAVVVTAVLVGCTLSASAEASCSIDDLAFMQGDWRYAEGPLSGEERWVLTAANTLAGSSWETKGAVLSFVEALSILRQNDGIEMHLRHFDGSLSHAWEDKDSPMVFTLTQCDGRSAVFDGVGSRAGEHITYRKTAEGLTFVGDFLHGGKSVHVESQMRPATK
jgi:hypothetical protein